MTDSCLDDGGSSAGEHVRCTDAVPPLVTPAPERAPNGLPVRILCADSVGIPTWRSVRPLWTWFGSTAKWLESQWLLDAVGVEPGTVRTFPYAGIDACHTSTNIHTCTVSPTGRKTSHV